MKIGTKEISLTVQSCNVNVVKSRSNAVGIYGIHVFVCQHLLVDETKNKQTSAPPLPLAQPNQANQIDLLLSLVIHITGILNTIQLS